NPASVFMSSCYTESLFALSIICCYYQFCVHHNIYLKKPSVCRWVIPVPYSYLQETYWNVGFLRMGSYEWNQRHNFILASPINQWISRYFISYILIGFIMHCNFLPWT
ncbi:GPI mannosyltransferase 2-like, partial [Gigantopelta aegis]|uniref:GPI mannosyltransferase 2-like n=1 Tax=Gigantopelta aegis TaxID=1735272 RepID=UPI001B8877C3